MKTKTIPNLTSFDRLVDLLVHRFGAEFIRTSMNDMERVDPDDLVDLVRCYALRRNTLVGTHHFMGLMLSSCATIILKTRHGRSIADLPCTEVLNTETANHN